MSTSLCSVTSYQNSIRTYELVHNLSLDTGSCPELCGILRYRRSPRVHACDREDELLEDVAPVWVSAVRPCRAPALGRRPPRWAPGIWVKHSHVLASRCRVLCGTHSRTDGVGECTHASGEMGFWRTVRPFGSARCGPPCVPALGRGRRGGHQGDGLSTRARLALPCAARHSLGNRWSRRVHACVR